MITELALVAMIAALALVVAVGCYGRIRDLEDSIKETDEVLSVLLRGETFEAFLRGAKREGGPPRPSFEADLPRRPSGRLRDKPIRARANISKERLDLDKEFGNILTKDARRIIEEMKPEIPTSIPEDF